MPPFTLGAIVARYVVSSASVGSTGATRTTTGPRIVPPLIDGDQGLASNLTFDAYGDVMKPYAFPGNHPTPRQVNGSRCVFIPQDAIVFTAQSAAAL